MTTLHSVAIIDDFKDTVDAEVESVIDKMALLIKDTIKRSANVGPAYTDNGIYDVLKSDYPMAAMVSSVPPPIKDLVGAIDVDATVHRAAKNLFYSALEVD